MAESVGLFQTVRGAYHSIVGTMVMLKKIIPFMNILPNLFHS